MAVDAMGPVLQEGQRNGEVRNDLEIDELIDFLVEQTYIAAEELDRSADAAYADVFAISSFRRLAGLRGVGGERLSWTREAEDAVDTAIEALSNLADQLQRGPHQ